MYNVKGMERQPHHFVVCWQVQENTGTNTKCLCAFMAWLGHINKRKTNNCYAKYWITGFEDFHCLSEKEDS